MCGRWAEVKQSRSAWAPFQSFVRLKSSKGLTQVQEGARMCVQVLRHPVRVYGFGFSCAPRLMLWKGADVSTGFSRIYQAIN